MELQFNELSVSCPQPCVNKYTADSKMNQFAGAVAEARKKGFRHIRSHYDTNQIILSPNYSLFDWLNSKDVQREHKDILYGMFVLPFIKENDAVVEKQYVEENYYFEDNTNGINRIRCIGLAGAYLYDTLCISLSTHFVWNQHKLPIIIEKENQFSTEEILNISSKDS
uniref:hypothetical protein n=1 Tax=Candidatus Symbiothrix dinenymphae TaxID=467085 RepID=UPI000A506418